MLLDLQALDSGLARLAHRRRSLPELAEIARLDDRLGAVRDDVVRAETDVTDLDREQRRLELDVDQVRARTDRDRSRLESGAVSPRDMVNMQHELGSLARRQGVLEDQVLNLMERRETADAGLSQLCAERERLEGELTAAENGRDAANAEIDAEVARIGTERAEVATRVPADLLALYEKIRAGAGGLGAAELARRRCSGCRLELTPVELGSIRGTAPDDVVRCEECRRILVRTAESGL